MQYCCDHKLDASACDRTHISVSHNNQLSSKADKYDNIFILAEGTDSCVENVQSLSLVKRQLDPVVKWCFGGREA